MNPLPWLPMITGLVVGGALPVAWWAAIDRQRWRLIRAYRQHRADVEARRHIEWARSLPLLERRVDYDPYWKRGHWDDEYDEWEDDEGWDQEQLGRVMSVVTGGYVLRRPTETRVARPEWL